MPALKALFSPRALREATSRYKKSSTSRSGDGAGATHAGGSRLGSIFTKSRGQEKIEGSGRVDTAVAETESRVWKSRTYPAKGIEVRTEFEMSDRRKDKDAEASSQECIVLRPDV